MFNATIHRLPNLRAKSISAQCGFFCKKLAIDPGRTWCCDLRLDRQIGSRRERGASAPLAVLVGAHLDHRTRFGVSGHLNVGKNEMVRASIDAFDDGISGAPQFVMEPPSYKSTLHRVGGLIAMQGATSQVGLTARTRYPAHPGFDDFSTRCKISPPCPDSRPP